MSDFDRLEIWTDYEAAGGTRVDVFPPNDVLKVIERTRLDGRDKLTLNVRRDSAIYSSVLDRSVFRVMDTDRDEAVNSFREWRASRIAESDDANAGKIAEIQCDSVRQELREGIIESIITGGDILYSQEVSGTPTELLTDHILPATFSYFAVGTIDPTLEQQITINWDSPLSMLQQIAKLSDARIEIVRLGLTAYNINLLVDAAPTGNLPELRDTKNIIGMKRTKDVDKMATRLYPRGEAIDSIHLTIAEAVWKVSAVSGTNITLVDPNSSAGPLAFDDQLNGFFFQKQNGTLTLINDSTLSTQVVDVASAADIAVNDLIKIRKTAGNTRLTFLNDPANVTLFGVMPRVLDRPDIPNVQNLVANRTLTGTYASGLAPNWTKLGGAGGTPTENTGILFRRRGAQSQKFASSVDGDGIQCDAITIAPSAIRPFFSAFAGVWLVKGRIRVEIEDVTNGIIIPTGDKRATTNENTVWKELGIAGIDFNSEGTASIRLRIVVDGDIDTEFYVDYAQVTQSPSQQPFFDGDGAVALWLVANTELLVNGVPRTSITARIADLWRIDDVTNPYDELTLGAGVKIINDALDISIITRILELTRDKLTDGATSVGLSNRPEDLTDIAFRTRLRLRQEANPSDRFDDPRIADPTIGPEQVSAVGITFPIVFDQETARIEVYTREDVSSSFPAPAENGLYHAGTLFPGLVSYLVEGTSAFYLQALFVSYDKDGNRGKAEPFGPTQFVDTGSGPTAAPTTLVCGTETTTTVPLTWSNNGDAASRPRVYRNTVIIATLNPGDTAFTDTGRIPNTSYNYEIDHFKDNQPSAKSNLVTCTTAALATLTSPTSFVAACDATTGMDFTWVNGDESAKTVIERATNVGFTTDVIELKTAAAGATAISDNSDAGGTNYFFRAFHRKTGFTDSAPTVVDGPELYFCLP